MSGPDLQEHTFVKVLYDFQYKTAEGREIAIKKNEKLYLLQKTNADWWQVVRTWEQRSFYVPATYVREMSKSSRKNSEEDRDAALAPLDGPKYKNMPKETSSAMRNVKKWLAGAIDSKQESSKMSYGSDESHKHHAMDYASRAELKVGLAAIKSKSLERDHRAEQSDQQSQKSDLKERKRSKEMQKKMLGSTMNDQDTSKASKSFSTSPKSFDMQPRMEMSLQDPFRKELESSLDRRRKKSDNTDFEKLVRENREQESLRDRRIRTKSSYSDDSHIESDSDERFLPRINEKPKKFDKPDQKLSLSLREESSSSRQSPNAPRRNSRSLETDARQFCMRTERSLSPKPTYGRQLTIAGGQIVDDELETNTSDHKILNDKRRTWAVEELMSELTQMCKDRVHSKKPNFQLKSTEIKSTFDPLDELTKELHEMNLLRSEGNTPQVEARPSDFKSTNASPSNISKISINVENTSSSLNSVGLSTQEEDDEPEDITEHSNISEASDISENSLVLRHPKQEKPSAFTFHTTDVIIPQSKSAKSPKSPKILDEYNEANILNDCSPDESLDDTLSLSFDKQSRYRKRTTNEASHSTIDNGHESPCYSNVKMHQTGKVKLRPKTRINTTILPGELRLTPSLEKLASEIQFIPARRTSDESKNASLNESTSDVCNDSGIHDATYKFDDSWDRKKILKYAGSFKTKREGRYFHRREHFEDEEEEDDDSMSSVKKSGLKKSSTLHFTTIPDNYRRFRTHNNLASNISQSFKRRSRSLSDLRCLEEEVITVSRQNSQESSRSPTSKPIPLPRTKIPAIDPADVRDDKPTDKVESNANRVRVPVPRKTSRKKEDNTMDDPWERFNLPGIARVDKHQNHLDQLTPGEIDIESSTAVGFKTLLCTSDSGSDNCLQSKELLSHNDYNDDHVGNRSLGKSSSGVNLKKEGTKTRESPSDEQILSSNASSEALQSQSESEVTAAFDASSQPSPVNARVAQDGYECAIDLPPGWTQKYDLHTDQICFINEQGDRCVMKQQQQAYTTSYNLQQDESL